MNIVERLTEILVKDYKLDPEKLVPEARLDELGVDSLGVMELVFKIEDEFGVRFPAEQVELVTIGDVVAYVQNVMTPPPATGAAAGAAASQART
ncbi:acyl carrier protein [Noviherbaspirillum sp. CPCC 100848]|uniref:Acyl carrier protein n=1 Tax=Noviherbaspirillum album TaxID=3080276 RepID=A0ABU6J2L9_9BURK|nr:acyl carrier protein [Noviherbaspirillum sp. CPCC 100848]MEC4717552.1 acyl carrier protein [Noviherbaspirillum sp. CPCC 100848]